MPKFVEFHMLIPQQSPVSSLDAIVSDIEDGNAILFLGPGATVNYGGHDLLKSFFEALSIQERSDWVNCYHDEDGLFVFKPQGRNRLGKRIADAYAVHTGNELLSILAEIPFHLIISLTPDHGITHTFEQGGFEYKFRYNDRKSAKDVGEYDADRPLIYNLLGSVESRASLVVSHGDLFELIEAIHKRNCLPIDLLSEFTPPNPHTKSLIFLGLEYDKWYFHFLVHLLQLNESIFPIAANEKAPLPQEQALYESHFRVKFVQDAPLHFAKSLLERVAPHRRRRAQPHRAQLGQFLLQGLTATELELICLTHFRDVQQEFTDGQSNSQRIRLLLEHVYQHHQYDRLMAVVKAANPGMFAQYFPDHGQ